MERWSPGTYKFKGKADEGEKLKGETELTHEIPAAPVDLEFDGSVISWAVADEGLGDLGECADYDELAELVSEGVLPVHPDDVEVAAWEVVFEPDVEAEDDASPEEFAAAEALGKLKFTIRLSGDVNEFPPPLAVTVPAKYLASLPDDTPAKIEVGAIGADDNASFTEEVDICVNETVAGCEFEDDDDDDDEE